MRLAVGTKFASALIAAILTGTFGTYCSVASKGGAFSDTVATRQQDKDRDQLQTFSGRIVSMNGELFILRDDANQVWFHLDDQRAAEKFAGKKAVVTGMLDPATDVIHVKSINEQKT